MRCVRPCGCFSCKHPDCICDDPPSRAEKRLAEMIDRDPGRWDAEAKTRERAREKAREYYRKNRQKIRDRQSQYYQEHRDELQAYGRSWFKARQEEKQ